MVDGGAASRAEIDVQLRKPGVRIHLYRMAFWSTRSQVDAEELVGAALARTLDPQDWPWIPSERSFLTHMYQVMRQGWFVERRGPRREIPADSVARDENRRSPDSPPDDALDRYRMLALYAELGDELRTRVIAADPFGARVLEGILHGDEPPEIAAAICCPVADVHTAMRRIKYRAKQIREAWEERERDRMRKLREQAPRKDKVAE
jgi:DNA-directed RNA polymerase specialized sigma24 family protein